MKNGMLFMAFGIALFLSETVMAGGSDWFRQGAQQARQDQEVGYRVAIIAGDEICRPPRDYNAAGFARPIDLLGTVDEPRGHEAENMKQWFCTHTRLDGTIVQYGSSFTPLEDWRNNQSRLDE